MLPIKRRKLSNDVLDRLVSAITSAEFPPGSQMPSERELMLRLDVGRPVVREAMQKLEQMGLLRISHGERARVVNPTPNDVVEQVSGAMVMMLATGSRALDDLKEARLLMETGMVRIATRRATGADLDRLAQAHRNLAAARANTERFVACDMAFHCLIAEISGNQLFAAVTRGMLDWMSRFKRELVSVRGADRITIAEHEKIYRAIAAGDADGAAAAMAEHLLRANSLYSQLLKEGPQAHDTASREGN
ncbi:transcriptional regulator NanR [Taklimakanibacter lacteus]|uniref:transcriptional regulator NanR n=1 Tax=Taklimakanibacter lacteus TaxID=2268456 RepID=UPI000E6653F0